MYIYFYSYYCYKHSSFNVLQKCHCQMSVKYFIFILFLLILRTKPENKREKTISDEPRVFTSCFENLGCVDTNEKWYHETFRPINMEPLDRHTIRTEFLLLKDPKNGSKEIVYDILTLKTETVEISGYSKGCTKFLIHDFTSNGHTGWIKHLAIAITDKIQCNIISVDWEAGAEPPYEQAIANARVVALETQAFTKMLLCFFGVSEADIHIIGHGIGAHIAGYVGKNIPGIDRITALDPTGPRFENMPSIVRLDVDDANYVEVLHTDAYDSKSQGTMQTLGHVDFYINNAGHQPGCNDTPPSTRFTDIDRNHLTEGKILAACSHKRAFKYYINSIVGGADCKFIGISCSSYFNYISGNCTRCDNSSTCVTFGLDKPNVVTKYNKYYMNTDADAPFCMNMYEANITISPLANSRKLEGYFEFMFIDENKQFTNSSGKLDKPIHRAFEPGHTYALIVYAPPPKIDTIKEAKVKWVCTNKFVGLGKHAIYIKEITIKRVPVNSETTVLNRLCPEQEELRNQDFVQFEKCDKIIPSTTHKTDHATECVVNNTESIYSHVEQRAVKPLRSSAFNRKSKMKLSRL